MENKSWKGWLYLLPAILFLGVFMVYPLVDVFIYSFEEGYNSASQTFYGVGTYNYEFVLHDPYVTNTLAVGLVFIYLFDATDVTPGLINVILGLFGMEPIDFIDGPYWAKMLVLCLYTVWIVLPFKILVLTSALASVDETYYKAARMDGTPKWRIFRKVTLPMISPTMFYLIITGFIGAFKAYSDAVALFGENLNVAEMNTIVGYVYDMLYGDSGGYPSFASAAAIILFVIVLTITCINLLVSKKKVHY